jgi:hypothetical protein
MKGRQKAGQEEEGRDAEAPHLVERRQEEEAGGRPLGLRREPRQEGGRGVDRDDAQDRRGAQPIATRQAIGDGTAGTLRPGRG